MRSTPSSALASSAPATVLVKSVSHEDSAIPLPWVSRLAKLNGKVRGKVVRLQRRLSKVWWLTYANKSEKRSKGMVEKLEMINK